jgi:uncharacterized membrane protein
MAPALAVLLGLAIILAAIGVLGWLGHLPLNGWAGIRLPSTMSSERAWLSAHRVAGPYSLGSRFNAVQILAVGTVSNVMSGVPHGPVAHQR